MAERDPKWNSLFVAGAYSIRHSFYFADNDKKRGLHFGVIGANLCLKSEVI